MKRAFLIGKEPDRELGYTYVQQPPWDGVVIGSLTLGQALRFSQEQALQALAEGKPVVVYGPGYPGSPGNRALAASLASARRELKSWGVVFSDGAQRRLITAREAQVLRREGKRPGPEAVLTPLAREILEGSD